MRDTKSKIDDWLNDVSTGFTGGSPDSQHCVVVGNRPQIQPGAPPATGYSPSCIFLGKALLVSTNPAQNDVIQAYSVFGCRQVPCNSQAALPTDYASAVPTPQLGLTETFTLAPANIVKVTANAPYADSQLVGFFLSLNSDQNSSQNGNSDVDLSEFKYNGVGTPPDQCLQLLGNCNPMSNPPKPLTSYKICLSDGARFADVIITSSNGVGAQTNLQYVNSLASC